MNKAKIREALEAADEAMQTWLCSHAPEENRAEKVEAARQRLLERGTLYYIAIKHRKILEALAILDDEDNG